MINVGRPIQAVQQLAPDFKQPGTVVFAQREFEQQAKRLAAKFSLAHHTT
jgi:hypothetical protein